MTGNSILDTIPNDEWVEDMKLWCGVCPTCGAFISPRGFPTITDAKRKHQEWHKLVTRAIFTAAGVPYPKT